MNELKKTDRDGLAIQVSNFSKIYDNKAVLENISFSVRKGETVGIIGPNGAGKSTLLKMLSEIVRPNAGKAILNGSVASILEVGMGFHPDLNGRENVFFAGQMMGFSKKRISEKMDEIVEFSELDGHMDKLVKFYSSGMYLRLAFSVFALLDTDILLLDEVLSVGDASFKRKSLEWMTEFTKKNKTVVLVSHNLNEIENFCDRVIYIDREVKMDSSNIRAVIMQYMLDHPEEPKIIDPKWLMVNPSNGQSQAQSNDSFEMLNEDLDLEITSITISDQLGEEKTSYGYDDEIRIVIKYVKKRTGVAAAFIWKVFDMTDNLLLATSPMFAPDYTSKNLDKKGRFSEQTIIPAQFLNTGRYYLTLVPTLNKQSVSTFHRLKILDVQHNDWMLNEPWAHISSPILHNFPWTVTDES